MLVFESSTDRISNEKSTKKIKITENDDSARNNSKDNACENEKTFVIKIFRQGAKPDCDINNFANTIFLIHLIKRACSVVNFRDFQENLKLSIFYLLLRD